MFCVFFQGVSTVNDDSMMARDKRCSIGTQKLYDSELFNVFTPPFPYLQPGVIVAPISLSSYETCMIRE